MDRQEHLFRKVRGKEADINSLIRFSSDEMPVITGHCQVEGDFYAVTFAILYAMQHNDLFLAAVVRAFETMRDPVASLMVAEILGDV